MASTVEERTIELNIVSAEDLKKVKTLGEQRCYVVAYIYRNEQKATKADKSGGLNPVWNAKLTLTCEEHLLQSQGSYITVEIHSEGTLRNKLVGSVTIPLNEVAKEGKSGGQIMAFQLMRPSGKVKGTLNMAVKLGELKTVQRYRSQQMPYGMQHQSQYPAAAYSSAGPTYHPPFAPQMQQYGGFSHMQQQPGMYGGGGYGGYGVPMGAMGGMGGYGGYPRQRPRRGGAGFGTGLLGGALGGMLLGDMMDNDCDDYGGGDMDMGDMGGD